MQGKVRIIGGAWRRRRLDVIDAADLRPTPDRVRETLFNWLQPWVEGAGCLDLYAGTGILGFEALSRGASGVTMVDSNLRVVHSLTAQARKLGAERLEIVNAEALRWLETCRQQFDIVFLDPPFSKQRVHASVDALLNQGIMYDGALLYVESDRDFIHGDDTRLSRIKSGKAGNVHYSLHQCRLGKT